MRKKVAVMFGGKSVEHEVSIISAVQAMEKFDVEKYEVLPVYMSRDNEFYYGEALRNLNEYRNIERLLSKCERVVFTKNEGIVLMRRFPFQNPSEEIITNVDLAFPIVHGTNVEDGILQGFLKTLDLPYVGCDVLSSAIGMDKHVMKVLLKSEGFPVLPCLMFTKRLHTDYEDIADKVENNYGFPTIVKPATLGSSVVISIAEDRAGLLDSIQEAFLYAKKLIVEPAITQIQEINCSVLGDSDECIASECEEPINEHGFLSYADKYINGSKKLGASKGMKSLKRRIPAHISDDERNTIRQISCDVFKYLDCCGVVRIDYIIDRSNNSIWLNEINTIPGSLAFYLWEPMGVSFSELIDRLVDISEKRYANEKTTKYDCEAGLISCVTKDA